MVDQERFELSPYFLQGSRSPIKLQAHRYYTISHVSTDSLIGGDDEIWTRGFYIDSVAL